VYVICLLSGAPWRSGIDTAIEAYRHVHRAPVGCVVRRERDGMRVSPTGALLPDELTIEAVRAALPGTEADVSTVTGIACDVAMAACSTLRDQGRAAWDGWRWIAVGQWSF
jgi:hypothetical protein